MNVMLIPNDKGNPAGKLADAELHFDDGPLQGLKLIGFAVCERRSGSGRNVTFPARNYSVDGAARSFVLLRATRDDTATDRIRRGNFSKLTEPTKHRLESTLPRRIPRQAASFCGFHLVLP
jgi:hypothetical protein